MKSSVDLSIESGSITGIIIGVEW